MRLTMKKYALKVIKFFERLLPKRVFSSLRNNLFFKSVWQNMKQKKEVSHYLRFRDTPINEYCILYESSNGAGMICNPYAIFKAFMSYNEFDRYRHVWVIAEKEELRRLKAEYRRCSNVLFIHRSSRNFREYARYMATAKYLIQNTTFPFFFVKRAEQKYVNTWHSVTVKTLGFDRPNGVIDSANMLKTFMQSDYIISANKFMTDIFLNSYRLNGLYEGTIIEDGHPRTDLTISSDRSSVIEKLRTRGINIEQSKKVILYAPTWRGKTVYSVVNDAKLYLRMYDHMHGNIDSGKYQILIKPHNFVYKKMSEQEQRSGLYIPQYVDTNELLSIVDILISDYSSIYFDFLFTNRPILFYVPDIKKYSAERGIYFKLEELPGPVTSDLDELCGYINNIQRIQQEYEDIRNETRDWACEYDNGNVSRKIIDTVVYNAQNYNTIQGFSKAKPKILFYPGEMGNNGLTEVFLTFIDNIDYDRFDVSIMVMKKNLHNVNRINAKARVFARIHSYSATRPGFHAVQHVLRHGFEGSVHDIPADKVFKMEYLRCFGDAKYDYVVNFSGYTVFFAAVLSHAVDAKKYIWQHNDFQKDFNNAEKIKLRGSQVKTSAILTTYTRYDKIIAVGKTLMEVNRETVSNEQTIHKYDYVDNPVGFDRVVELLKYKSLQGIARGGKGILLDVENGVIHYLRKYGNRGVKGYFYHVPRSEGAYKFVTMGRLSPEKNHKVLINAFARFKRDYPKSILHIIGDGKLRKSLNSQIRKKKMDKNIFLTGNLQNPFALINQSDCFILPSLYEGQSIAVLEMRVLKIPIILSDYSTVASALIPNGQLVIGMTEDDIYHGLHAFVNGDVPCEYEFDGEAYNAECFRQFEALFT